MAQVQQPIIPHNSQRRQPLNQVAVIQAGIPAGWTPLQYQQYLDHLRRQAGPQLYATLPPWYRPGPVAGPQHAPAWPGRAPNYMVPIAFHPGRIPDLQTEQDELNHFFYQADQAFGGTQAANGAAHDTDRLRYGPRVYPRQVSTRDANDRTAVFPHHQVNNRRMFNPAPNRTPVMTLAEYSATISEFRGQVQLTQGTLVSVASAEPQAGVAASTAWQHFQANVPGGGAGPALLPRPNYWHAAGVFLQSHRHYPQLSPPGQYPPGTPSWQRYRFSGQFRHVFIYDSSYINETAGAGLVTQSLAQTHNSRIAQHSMMSMVQRLLYGSPNGLAPSTGNARCAWIRNQGVTRIGGGGNIGGIDECQRMTCIWMLQVAELSRALGRAIARLYHFSDQAAENGFLQAEREWGLFFADYTEVRP